ncbi:hypothetical protein Tco_1193147 [Tanacetum coccineum]
MSSLLNNFMNIFTCFVSRFSLFLSLATSEECVHRGEGGMTIASLLNPLNTWNVPRCLSYNPPTLSTKMESSATREYPSLIHTLFLTHTVGGVFLNLEDKALYDVMLRLKGLGFNTSTGVPYTEDEIIIVRGGKQRGHIPSVGRVLPGQGIVIPPSPLCTHSSDVAKLKKSEKRLTKQVKMFMKLFRSDDMFSQMLTQLESPKYGGGSGSGGCGDDEPGVDEDGDEDEEEEEDG